MKSKSEIAKQFKKHMGEANRLLTKQFSNTKACQAFYAGDSMDYRDTVQFQTDAGKKKAIVKINKVKPYVNAVAGFMAQNRRQSKYLARINAPQAQKLYSQYADAVAAYCRSNANADQVETQQDKDLLINGYGATETELTYGDGYATTEPNGEVVCGRLDPLCVKWDPHAKASNLLDARFTYTWKDYALSDAIDLFQDAEEEEFEDVTTDDEGDYKYNPRGGAYSAWKERGLDWVSEEEKRVRVYFYQWYEVEKYYRADNPIKSLTNTLAIESGMRVLESIAIQQEEEGENEDMFSFDPRADILIFNEKVKNQLVSQFGKFIQPYPARRKVFYKALVSGDHVFKAFKTISQQGFTIKFKTGDYDSKNKIWTGMVNSLMEPMAYYNKALTEVMFAIAASSKGGVMYERGSIEDIRKFERNYAKTDAAVEVTEGALTQGRIKPKREGYQPTGNEQILGIADQALADVSGVDRTFLGSSENKEETGILQRQRIKQVVSTLATYFDALTLYAKEHARLMLDLMRVYAENNQGALIRILGENGKNNFLKLNTDHFAAEYDIVIQEAPQGADEKAEQAKTIMAIGDRLIQTGDPAAKVMYAMAVKFLPLDDDDIQKITEALLPKDNQIDPAYVQQLEQQVKALMNENVQADVKKKLSDMMLNMAKIDQVTEQTKKTTAETAKTLEDARHTDIESELMLRSQNVNVTI